MSSGFFLFLHHRLLGMPYVQARAIRAFSNPSIS